MNRIEEVAKMLGVELGERFQVREKDGNLYADGELFYIDKNSLQDEEGYGRNILLVNIIKGDFEMVKQPFKPKFDDDYWYVDIDADVTETSFSKHCYSDLFNFKIGNCFRTAQEAEEHKDEIIPNCLIKKAIKQLEDEKEVKNEKYTELFSGTGIVLQ